MDYWLGKKMDNILSKIIGIMIWICVPLYWYFLPYCFYLTLGGEITLMGIVNLIIFFTMVFGGFPLTIFLIWIGALFLTGD